MSRKNQFIGVRSRALFSVLGATREGGRKEETAWKYKRTVKNSNEYVRLDVLVVYAKMLEARAQKPGARSPIDTPGTRATEAVKIARAHLREKNIRIYHN